MALQAVQHGGILAFLERERQAAKATNYLLNPAVKAAWEVELECVLSRFEVSLWQMALSSDFGLLVTVDKVVYVVTFMDHFPMFCVIDGISLAFP